MKGYMVGLICGMSLLATIPKVSAETIKMMYGNLPPYMYLDEQTRKAQGASVAFFEAVATQMGHTVEWVGPLPQARFLHYITTTDNDMVGAISIVKYAQTEDFMEFPDLPYFLTQSTVAVRHEDPLKEIRTIDDLRGYRIGGMAGDKLPIPFDQLQIEPIFEDLWIQLNLKKLVAHRIDAVFSREAPMLTFEAARLQLGTKIRIISLPASPTRFYVAFRKAAPQSKQLVEQYNAAVKTHQIIFDEFLDKELAATTSH